MREPLAFRVVKWITLVTAVSLVLIPTLWMVLTAVKPLEEVLQSPPKLFVEDWSLDAFASIFTQGDFGRYFLNSFLVVGGATVIALVFSVTAAYGCSRFKFLGRSQFLAFLLISQMFPSIMLLVPYYRILKQAGMINTLGGLVVVYVSFLLPLATWMMISYFDSVPSSLDEQAAIDGAGKWRTFFSIVMPLVVPGLAATGIYAFVTAWNEYMFALTLLQKDEMKTVPVGIGGLVGEYDVAWNQLMAASLVALLPLVLVFVFLQRHFVAGITAGAVK